MAQASPYSRPVPESSGVGVLTVDDQPVFRAAACELIESTPGFFVLGEAAGGSEALSIVRQVEPELVLVDLRMPGMSGIETARRIRTERPRSVVVLVSLDEPVELRSALATSGAAAFVLKQDFGPALLRRLWSAYGQCD
jgi:DNA-binding NarL/FixJ family response regulator